MHRRERLIVYWPAIAWALWVLFVNVQHGWALWGAHSTTRWSLGDFVLQLMVPIERFLLSALVLPPREEEGAVDLSVWFFQNRAWFYAILFTIPVSSLTEELVRSGGIASRANLSFQLAFAASTALGSA